MKGINEQSHHSGTPMNDENKTPNTKKVPTLHGDELEKLIAQGNKQILNTDLPLAKILHEIKTFKQEYQVLNELKQTFEGHNQLIVSHT